MEYQIECPADTNNNDICTNQLKFPIGEFANFELNMHVYIDSAVTQAESYYGIRFRENSIHEYYLIMFNAQGDYRFIHINPGLDDIIVAQYVVGVQVKLIPAIKRVSQL